MTDFGLFQTVNIQMKKMLETAQSISLTPAPLLISGEQGVGKSLLVQFVLEKARFQKTLHRWGRDLNGLQDGDVILIENLSDLNLLNQQELSERMDELKHQGRRVRWIATCAENPMQAVQQQRLRKDLFYRLSVIHLLVPSLRDRSEDILILADFFSQVLNLMKSRPIQKFSADAKAKLVAYGWPGNVTELESVIERAISLSEGDEIHSSAIQFVQVGSHVLPNVGTTLSDMERKLILQTLQLTQQNKTRAAQILGISIRTLRNKLNEYREAGVL